LCKQAEQGIPLQTEQYDWLAYTDEEVDEQELERDKDMQKNLALIAKYFKKIYKPTNNNLRTSSNSKNKNVDTTSRFKNDNESGQFGTQRTVKVAAVRENVGNKVVQQSGIQCFNCKEYGHFAKECIKLKRVKDSAYHKEKMLLYKQAEHYMAKIQEVPTADSGTDSEPVEQVQNDARHNVFANHLQHYEQSVSNTCLVETNASNVIPDSPDMCEDDIQNEQNDVDSDDERVALANLIANLKLDVDENKKIQKQLKKANTTHSQELKECKAILAETSKSLGESISVRDSCLVALQTKQAEFEKFKTFNDRTVDYDKLKRKLNESLGQLAHKDTVIREGLKTKAYELSVVKEKHDELLKQSLLTKSHYEGLVKQKTKVITNLKLREEHDIEKMLSMEKQLKFLNEIVYKRSQSIQTIHIIAPNVPTYNGRPTFANPRYLKQAQSEIPCLYAFPYDQNTHANRLILDGEETLALERESRSKPNKDSVRPYDYTKLNSLYEIFKPPTQEYKTQLAHANEIRRKMWQKYFVKSKPNIYKNVGFFLVSKSISKSRQTYNVMTNNINHFKQIVDDAWIKHSKDLFRVPTAHDMEILIQTCLMPFAIKTQSDSLKFVHELKQEMHADLKYAESLKKIDELESDKAEFLDMYDVILQECVSKDVMCSYLQSLSDLDMLAELQCMYLHKVKECDCLAQRLSKQTESVSKKVHIELLQRFAKVEKHSISLELAFQNCKEHVKNDTNIAISELKKLIEKSKGKSVDTKFDRPSVVRQPNAQRIPKPSVLGKPTPFSDSLERNYFPKTKSDPKANVSEGLSKPVTAQTLTQTVKKAVSNTNVLRPGMYRIDNRTAHTKAPQLPHTVRNTNPRVSTSTEVNHKPNVSRSQLKSNQSRDKVLPNNSQVKIVQLILFIVDSGCTKNMTGNLKLLCNFVEKFLETVRFGNDQFAPILGYEDLVQGNVTINRVYYVECLNHNLFSVGQFCDANLKVAFRKSTCFVRDLQGNDLLTGNRGSNLYTISLQESTSSTTLCLMAKATPTQAWLWHRRLSHLNFDYINLLSKKDIVIVLPKLKYVKDQLCSSCELSKAKRSSFKLKAAPSLKERLNLLHMDLCDPIRVASINGKKYILVIVDDYSRYTDGENLDKMKEKGDLCILVGYSTQSKGYRVYNKKTRMIVESIHNRFDEIKEVSEMSVANNTLGLVPQRQNASDYDNPNPSTPAPSTHTNVHAEENNNDQAEEGEQLRDDEFTNPFCAPAQEEAESSSHNIGNSNVPTFNQPQVSEYRWMKDHPLEQEGAADSAWIEAMQEELHQFDRLQAWELVDKPFGKSIIRLKWLWKNKKDEDQTVIRNKARLVAKRIGLPSKESSLWIEASSKVMAKYTLEILHKHGMDKGQSIGTPMATKPKLDADLSENPVDQTDYHSKIRSLVYLTSSRPDIVQAGSSFEITAFSDADHAGCIDSRKITSGGIQFLGDKLVSWMSKKHNCTAMSSAEAEYVALSASCAQIIWMRTQL
nr:integrase, catalytic region, zinc finger, CCHC-type, peptidase aspartic, catalytic [Tanacetum cinerariifolium]